MALVYNIYTYTFKEGDSRTICYKSTSIVGGRLFEKSNVESVVIPEGITIIEHSAFEDCSNLTSVTIPNSVTSIGDSAFYGSISLSNVTIPNSVTDIGDRAFYYCQALESVSILATTPPTLGIYAFEGNKSGRKIYVPSESVNAYKAAEGWSAYAADIMAIQS